MRLVLSLLNYRPGEIGGAETYLLELCRALERVRGPHEVVLAAHRGNADAVSDLGLPSLIVDREDHQIVKARALEAFTPYRARFAEQVIASVAPDVVLFPQQSVFPKRVASPVVLAVIDLQHLAIPQNFTILTRCFRRAIYDCSLTVASQIITISEATRRSVLENYPQLDAQSVVSIPLGMSELSKNAKEGDVDPMVAEPYLYYPAASHPHKNHQLLLRCIAELRQRDCFPYKMVFSGRKTSHWSVIEREIERLGVRDTVHHAGHVPYESVIRLYKGCEAVVFPSGFEGFGLPVLEAAAMGEKVITSQLEIFKELGVPEACRIRFEEGVQLERALGCFLAQPLEVRPSTWNENARKTLEVCSRTIATTACSRSAPKVLLSEAKTAKGPL